MKTFLKSLPISLLVLLFIYAVVSKLLAFDDFRGQLLNQTFPHWIAGIALYALPAAELAAVCLMLFPKAQLYGLILSAVVMLVFTGYIGLVLAGFWPRVPCSCGGILTHLSWQAHFLFNIFFLLLSLIALYLEITDKRPLTAIERGL